MARRAAHHAPEGSAKRAFRFVPERAGDWKIRQGEMNRFPGSGFRAPGP
jgi:hypothetical protein